MYESKNWNRSITFQSPYNVKIMFPTYSLVSQKIASQCADDSKRMIINRLRLLRLPLSKYGLS